MDGRGCVYEDDVDGQWMCAGMKWMRNECVRNDELDGHWMSA